MNNQQKRQSTKLLAIIIAGTLVRIDPASIKKDERTVLHGEFKGVEVNSPAIYSIGESVVIWPDADKPFAVSIGKAELGVLATRFLQSEGLTVIQA